MRNAGTGTTGVELGLREGFAAPLRGQTVLSRVLVPYPGGQPEASWHASIQCSRPLLTRCPGCGANASDRAGLRWHPGDRDLRRDQAA